MHWCKSGHMMLNNSEWGLGFLFFLSSSYSSCQSSPVHIHSSPQRNLAVTVSNANARLSTASEESGEMLRRPIRYQSFCLYLPLLNHLSCSIPENQCRKPSRPAQILYSRMCSASLNLFSISPDSSVSNRAISLCLQPFL